MNVSMRKNLVVEDYGLEATGVTSKTRALEKIVGRNSAVVVDSTLEILKVVDWSRAVTMVVSKDAYIVLPRSDGALVRSQHLSLPKPLVVGLSRYVPWRDLRGFNPDETKVSYSVIHVRDHWTCQYCGRILSHSQATVDHVIPRSKGGRSTWNNLCTSCMSCNNRKGCRTPEEAGMANPSIPAFKDSNRIALMQSFLYGAIEESSHITERF